MESKNHIIQQLSEQITKLQALAKHAIEECKEWKKLCDEASVILRRFSFENKELSRENEELREQIAADQGVGAPSIHSQEHKDNQEAYNKALSTMANNLGKRILD